MNKGGTIQKSKAKVQKIIGKLSKSNKSDEIIADNSEERVLAIINNLTDAVLNIDTNGVVQLYNAASMDLLDTNGSLKGRHIDELVPLTDQDDKKIGLFKDYCNTSRVIKRDDLNYTFDYGESIRLEITFAPIRSGYNQIKKAENYEGYIVILRDITKQKSLEEERDEFISVTSHELRTPITIAEGTLSNAQVMIDHPNATPKMIKDSINLAHDQVVFLANMVNDLSTLSRAERGVADSAEDINVAKLAHKLHDKYQMDASKKDLHLNLDISPKLGVVHVSRLYLEELLQNFITNAIKYTKKGTVTIDFKLKNGIVTFAVRDTGIGISKSDQKNVYKKFYRSEDYRTRESGGTGLGLYIGAKLSKKLGTQINLVSRLNFGSTFSFDLPISSEVSES